MGVKVTRNGPGLREALEGGRGEARFSDTDLCQLRFSRVLGRGKRKVREFRVNIQEVSGEMKAKIQV